MNEITQKIIDLDKETINLRKKYEDLLRKKKMEGLDKVQELEQELLKTYVEEGEKAYQETLKQTDGHTDKLNKVEVECISNMTDIDKVYYGSKKELVDSLWEEILQVEE